MFGGSAREVTLINTPGETAALSVQIIAHQNVFDRMSVPPAGQKPYPESAWPTDSFVGVEKEVFFNGEAIQMFHPPAAHTDGDTIVFFRRSDVISAGDIFVTDGYPGHRSEERRQLAGRDQRAEPDPRPRDPRAS